MSFKSFGFLTNNTSRAFSKFWCAPKIYSVIFLGLSVTLCKEIFPKEVDNSETTVGELASFGGDGRGSPSKLSVSISHVFWRSKVGLDCIGDSIWFINGLEFILLLLFSGAH